MKQMQEKSPCCRGQVWRVGERRRQCKACRKTWRAWPKKRGRKARRSNDQLLLRRYLDNQLSVSLHASRPNLPGRHGVLARLRATRDEFNATHSWPQVTSDPSIIIADAFEETINGVTRTGYLGFIRPFSSDQAIILPPYYQMGKETAGGWEAAFASYGSSLDNVHALVCDGCVGLTRQAHIRGWVLQRCQFHLWHGLNNYLRIPRQGSPQNHAIRVHRLIRIVLESPEDKLAEQAVEELRAVLPLLSSRGAHKVVRGFVGHWRNYRSFISYPYLNLPRTSNCAEQGVCLIRRLQQSARGWNSYPALEAWAETVIKHKRTVTCKPSLPTKLI